MQKKGGCTVADSVACVSENGVQDRCLGASVASLGVSMALSRHIKDADSAGETQSGQGGAWE